MKYNVRILQVRVVENSKIVICEIKSGTKTFRRNYAVSLTASEQDIIGYIQQQLAAEIPVGTNAFEVDV